MTLLNAAEGGGTRRSLRTSGLEILLGVLVSLLVLDSFLPWYREGVLTTSPANGFGVFDDRVASSWESSSGWTVGVVCCSAAGFGRLAADRVRPAGRPRWMRWAFVAAAAAGLVTTVVSWALIPSGAGESSVGLSWVLQTTAELDRGVVRDHLHFRAMNVVWGYNCGVVLMIGLVLVLTAMSLRAGQDRI
jgi:hypothetical protein